MDAELEEGNAHVFAELQELVAMEVRDIIATAKEEGFERSDVIHALEAALQAEIRALETGGEPLVETPVAE